MKQILILFFCLVSFQAISQDFQILEMKNCEHQSEILWKDLDKWFDDFEEQVQAEFEARLAKALDKYIYQCQTDTLETTLDLIWNNLPPGFFDVEDQVIRYTENPSMSGFLKWLKKED